MLGVGSLNSNFITIFGVEKQQFVRLTERHHFDMIFLVFWLAFEPTLLQNGGVEFLAQLVLAWSDRQLKTWKLEAIINDAWNDQIGGGVDDASAKRAIPLHRSKQHVTDTRQTQTQEAIYDIS